MVEQLFGLESCKGYVQTPIQTLDSVYVHEPCCFLPLPVPLDAERYTGTKRGYTQIMPKTEYIALTKKNYVPLTLA